MMTYDDVVQGRKKPMSELKGVRDAAWETAKLVPFVGAVPSAIDYVRDVSNGDTVSAMGNAASIVPGYGLAKAGVAQGIRHLLPHARSIMADPRMGLRLNGQLMGNQAQVKSAYDTGNAWGGVRVSDGR